MMFSSASLRRRYLAAVGLLPLAACGEPGTECLTVDSAETCPSQEEASGLLVGAKCGYSVNAVTGEGEKTVEHNPWDTGSAGTPACCYPTLEAQDAFSTCVVGRPYIEAGTIRTAPPRRGRGWARGRRPNVGGLSAAERSVLAAAWTEDALVEHASVAAFARTTLELLAVGAPADLIAAVQAAAADEVRHAQLSFALAEAYAGAPVAAGPFALGPSISIETDVSRIAAATFREGCVGETVVAMLSARAAALATDPAARALLAVVARDEARHAELAWRTLAWALDAGGAAARVAVEAEVVGLLEQGVRITQVTNGASDAVLSAHGRIRQVEAERARDEAMYEVILPCVRAILGHSSRLAA